MHDAMAARVMRAPVGWFERTPLGRILNRFSSDIQEIDKDVMDGLGSTLACLFAVLAIVIVISYTVRFPGFIFCIAENRSTATSDMNPSKLWHAYVLIPLRSIFV